MALYRRTKDSGPAAYTYQMVYIHFPSFLSIEDIIRQFTIYFSKKLCIIRYSVCVNDEKKHLLSHIYLTTFLPKWFRTFCIIFLLIFHKYENNFKLLMETAWEIFWEGHGIGIKESFIKFTMGLVLKNIFGYWTIEFVKWFPDQGRTQDFF